MDRGSIVSSTIVVIVVLVGGGACESSVDAGPRDGQDAGVVFDGGNDGGQEFVDDGGAIVDDSGQPFIRDGGNCSCDGVTCGLNACGVTCDTCAPGTNCDLDTESCIEETAACFLECIGFNDVAYFACYPERTASACEAAYDEVCPNDLFPTRVQSETVLGCDRCFPECAPAWWTCELNNCNIQNWP